MSFFSSSSFKNALDLPIKSAIGAATGVVGDLITQGVQKAFNFGLPSAAKKAGEAISKLKENGVAEKFNKVCKGINITKENGQIITKDEQGNKGSNVGSYQTTGVAAAAIGYDNENETYKFKVKIWQQPTLIDESIDMVIFDVMPTISENRNVTYDASQIIHHPGEILKYKSTSSRTFGIRAKLVSRNPEEAFKNKQIINLIRSWAMPFYGTGTEKNDATARYLGAPPPILTLEAYGEEIIGPVKCVLESYDWSWPNDVDYIATQSLEPFPVLIDISLNLKETYSPAEYSSFDLMAFRNGYMNYAFSSASRESSGDSSPQVAPADVDTSSSPSVEGSAPSKSVSDASLPSIPDYTDDLYGGNP